MDFALLQLFGQLLHEVAIIQIFQISHLVQLVLFPKGGNPSYYGANDEDPINERFLADEKYQAKIQNTMTPSEVDPSNYTAILYAGGHGTMWDFADNAELALIAQKIYENNGIVSAVCHGPAGLVNIKLSNGNYLVDGKKINAFTNEEEVS